MASTSYDNNNNNHNTSESTFNNLLHSQSDEQPPAHSNLNADYPPEKTSFRDLAPEVHPIAGASGDHHDRNSIKQGENSSAMDRQYEQGNEGRNNPDSLQSLGEGGHLHNIRGTTHIPGEENQDPSLRERSTYVDDNNNNDESIFRRPQGESEYPGRTQANVVSHDQYNNLVGDRHDDPYNQPNQHQQHEGLPSAEQREAEQQREIDAAADNHHNNGGSGAGFAGVGALGSNNGYPHDQLQPSRSYINESRPTTIQQRPDENFGQANDNAVLGGGRAGNNDADHDGIRDDVETRTVDKRNSLAGGLLDKMLGRSATKKTIASSVKDPNRVSRQPSYAGTGRTAGREQELQPLQNQQQGQFIEGDPHANPEQANHHLGLASAAGAGAPAVAVGTNAGYTGGEQQGHHLMHQPTQTHLEGANAAGTYDGLGHQQQMPLQQEQQQQQQQQYLNQQQQPLVPLNQQPHYQQGGDIHREPSQATNRQSYVNGQTGPSTGVQPAAVPAHDGFADPSRARPVSGGGLAAAIATSGHKPTKQDKKALKTEIRDEKKYEKNLKKEAILERQEIEAAAKQAKRSDKKAAKSASYEASFRSTYEKAIKKEVKAKQHLLKITNEYNKVAADLERATKEMEIRRNNHLADQQTRDADQQKVDDLRHRKGQNDMDREGRHGQSITKQNQAKRALSQSTKRNSILG